MSRKVPTKYLRPTIWFQTSPSKFCDKVCFGANHPQATEWIASSTAPISVSALTRGPSWSSYFLKIRIALARRNSFESLSRRKILRTFASALVLSAPSGWNHEKTVPHGTTLTTSINTAHAPSR